MVQHRGNLIPQRNFYPPREPATWTNDRNPDRSFETVAETPRLTSVHSVHLRSLPIDRALKECVGLSDAREFAMVTLQNNGEIRTYASHSLREFQGRIFSPRFKDNFQSVVRQASIESSCPNSVYGHDNGGFNDYEGESSGRDCRKQSTSASDASSSGGRRRHHSRRRQEVSDDDGSGSASRKRKRGWYTTVDQEDDTPLPMQVTKTQQLKIGDDEEVHKFYNTRFKDMQQSSCKVLGKAFVKLIEPKKQTHHPYTKGDEKRPPWWPPTTGENCVRHREPDHLLKPERVRLLTHILEMVIEPYENQHPTVQKLDVNVKKLEDVTMEAMNNWFNDREHPANAAKKPFLKEIFKVAKQQERYKKGEIDDTTRVSVMSGDNMGNSSSDDEPEEDDAYDDIDNTATLMHTPDSLVSPTASMMQNILPGPRPMDDSRAREMDLVNRQRQDWHQPQRYHTQPQAFGEQKMDEQNPSFQSDSFRPKWDLNGGSSFHHPQPDSGHHGQYQSPQQQHQQHQQQNLYSWQSNMPIVGASTNGPSTQPFYTTSPPSADPRGYQLPPLGQQAMPPPPLTLSHSGYGDNLPSCGTRYDTGATTMGSQMRTGSLGHPYGGRDPAGSGGYSDFLNEHGGFNHADDPLKDEQQHHLHPQ